MSPLVKTITLILININQAIDSLNTRTVEAIKAGFYIFIFILMAIGAIIGYRNGMENAQIKSPPLIQTTNESFELDIKRENRERFSSVLESKLITEMKSLGPEKIPYPVNESMTPETNRSIIEPEETSKFRPMPDTMDNSETVDNAYSNSPSQTIQPLKREFEQADAHNDIMKDQNKPLENVIPSESHKLMIKPAIKSQKSTPGMIEKDRGIIE